MYADIFVLYTCLAVFGFANIHLFLPSYMTRLKERTLVESMDAAETDINTRLTSEERASERYMYMYEQQLAK